MGTCCDRTFLALGVSLKKQSSLSMPYRGSKTWSRCISPEAIWKPALTCRMQPRGTGCSEPHLLGLKSELRSSSFRALYVNVAALEHFCDRYWPCSFVSRRGKACVNVKYSHTAKGHQTARGKIISSGPSESAFSSFNFSDQWKMFLKKRLQEIEAGFQEKRKCYRAKKRRPPNCQ